MKKEDGKSSIVNRQSSIPLTRRQFATRAGAGILTVSVLDSHIVRSYAANSRVKIGIIGCGGRGTWIAKFFAKHGGYDVVAGADYFRDRVDDFGTQLQVPEARRYTGLAGYKRLLESDVEAVAIESPPYFHPDQAAAAVAAGKHVYLAKPIAVDVPGCQLVGKSSQQATGKKLVFLVDFQTRANAFYQEAIKRVHEGALGEMAFGESTYHADNPFEEKYKYLEADAANPENRLRAWGLDRVLSGDIITEQNIHTLDVQNWIMKQPPVSALGTGGLKGRRKLGTCWDHFTILFTYPDNLGITFSSRQFKGHGTRPEGIRNRLFGSKGVLETEYGGQVLIRGDNFYRGGDTNRIYDEGAINNIATFHQNISSANYQNATTEPSVQSNLITVLGRTAAYERRVVTWNEMMKKAEPLDPRLKGLSD
ncbi:MAG: gfo/Idh/MocA family oxidoreductase [Acidobacteria bacterium]|nr:MAG: gfo/Idh/MocA family oxidoreductase [Acidobacteriota bacterium]